MEMTKLYALFNPDGKMVKCSMSIDNATNHFPVNTYSTKMWNALFGANTEKRVRIYKMNGWAVKAGRFTTE